MIAKLHTSPRLFAAMLVIIYLLGAYASLNTGISWDETMELNTLRVNAKAVGGLLQGDPSYYNDTLIKYSDRYYGIGFHAPAVLVQAAAYLPVRAAFGMDDKTALVLSKHIAVYTVFFLSGMLVLLIVELITSDKSFSRLSAIAYLLWPYLFGHGLMNVKDTPFLFAWLLCTYLSLKLGAKYLAGSQFQRREAIMLGIGTGWLLSIRISGLLVFAQYVLLVLIVLIYGRRHKIANHGAKLFGYFLSFVGTTALFVFVAYPVFWHDPLEIFNAIAYMSHISWPGCTLTMGECMSARALPPTYLPAWLIVKLPLLVMIGYALLPFALFKVAKIPGIGICAFVAFCATTICIPVLLILKQAALYDELRQVLFLAPLFFIVAIVSIYLISRNLALLLLILTTCFFIVDNFKAYPYQYAWFNEPARLFDISKYYETDYWGTSSKRISSRLITQFPDSTAVNCIYTDPPHLYKAYLPKELYRCVQPVSQVTESTPRPYYIARLSRGVFKYPNNCAEVWLETFDLFLSRYSVTVGSIYYCGLPRGERR